MMKMKELPVLINGFRIVEDLGYSQNKKRYCIAICKKCSFNFKARCDTLINQKSCKCTHNFPKRLVSIYNKMKQRCDPKESARYRYHSGKGITVCEQWLFNKVDFYLWSMLSDYSDSKTIDRIDPTKNYTPENCRWVSVQVQVQNNSDRVLNFKIVREMRELSKSHSCAFIARKYGVSDSTAVRAIRGITWSNA